MSGEGLPPLALAVVASAETDQVLAQSLSDRLGLPLAPLAIDPATCLDYDALLLVSGQSLALQQTPRLHRTSSHPKRDRRSRRPATTGLPGPVAVDFGDASMRHRRRAGHNELLGRAVGVSASRCPAVLDATAGLARDAFVLADMGCSVTMCEREPVIAALLNSALQIALSSTEPWLSAVAARLDLFEGDARQIHESVLQRVDVICLDPMFPARSKSAAVKKEMALFHSLLQRETPAQTAEQLLEWALQQHVDRVVVKRPLRSAYLGGKKPSHEISGKAIRFDVYVMRASH